jgi:transposase
MKVSRHSRTVLRDRLRALKIRRTGPGAALAAVRISIFNAGWPGVRTSHIWRRLARLDLASGRSRGAWRRSRWREAHVPVRRGPT